MDEQRPEPQIQIIIPRFAGDLGGGGRPISISPAVRFQNDLQDYGWTVALRMRAVIQRVSEASVTIEHAVKGTIQAGLVVLLAIEEADLQEDIDWLSGKIVRLRVFADENGVMNRSVQEVGGGILLISQFTLYASTRKGNRPSYSRSAKPEIAIPLYQGFIQKLTEALGKPIQTGEFGADMQVSLVNDGPVTIIMDSKLRE